MSWKIIRVCLFSCSFLILSCAAMIGAIIFLFTFPLPRQVPINLNDLLVDVSSLPTGTQISQGAEKIPRDPDVDLNSEDNLSIFFSVSEGYGLSEHFLYKFPNEIRAQWEYRAARGLAFYPQIANWSVPEGWTYTSPSADEFIFLCGKDDFYGVIRCSALGRYGEVISEFSTPLVPGVMTLEQVEHILREIDARMAKYLR